MAQHGPKRYALRRPADAAVVLALLLGGCAPTTIDLVANAPTTQPAPQLYDDRAWATVLRENVNNRLVDYAHLQQHAEPLAEYLTLLARIGPQSTPEQFKGPQAKLAYYINAYNAGVLAAVVREKAPATMYPAGRPLLDYRFRLHVDGRLVTLADLRTAARAAGAEDVRVEFALCGAARGCPALADQPFRADSLARQLEEVARAAMEQPSMVQIDHANQRLLVGLPIAERREAFLAYSQRLTGSAPPSLLSPLLQMASGVRREWFNTAIGYKEGLISFDRTLNARTPE